MALNLEGIPFGEYVAGLPESTDPHAGTLLQKVGNEIKELGGNALAKASAGTDEIHNLTQTATEADLVAGNYFALAGAEGTKRLPAELLATTYTDKVYNGKLNVINEGVENIRGVYSKDVESNSFVVRNTQATALSFSNFTEAKKVKDSVDINLSFSVSHTEIHQAETDPEWAVQIHDGSGIFTTGHIYTIVSKNSRIGDFSVSFNLGSLGLSWENITLLFSLYAAGGVTTAIQFSDVKCSQFEPFKKLENIQGNTVQEIIESIDGALDNVTVDISAVTNGKILTYKEGGNFDLRNAAAVNPDNSFVMRRTAETGSAWSYFSTPIVPNFSRLVKVEFDVEKSSGHTAPLPPRCTLFLSDGSSSYASGNNVVLMQVQKDIAHVSTTFDPSYYAVYKDPSWNQFNLWFAIVGQTGGTSEYKVSNLVISQIVDDTQFENFSGMTCSEILTGIDAAISTSSKEKLLVSPSGNKFEIAVNDDGTISCLPIIPTKAFFFGNSLLSAGGFFGMAASEESKDYFHLFKSYVQNNLNPNYTASWYSGGTLEGLTSESSIASTVSNLISHLDGDEDLVVVQLGDNVNNPEKLAVFDKSSKAFLAAIRNKCRNARVVWFGMWYSSATKYEYIKEACVATGCKFVSMESVDKQSNCSYIGALIKRGLRDYTISDVVSVTPNSDSNITVKFAVTGTEYETTMDVNSWNLDGNTLTYNGEYWVVTAAGVASHPGDEGMAVITNILISALGYTE